MAGRTKIIGGVLLLAVLAALGPAAKTAALTNADLRLDEHLAGLRTPALTLVAKAATLVAQAAVGAVIAVVVPAILWLLRRRRDALLTACLMIGALGIAYVAKTLVAEHRPPKRLWVIPPDNAMSFPSGHATVAAAVAIILGLLVRGRLRPLALTVGVMFAGVVAFARMYLGVHYLLDVVGGCLAAVSAALLVSGFYDLPRIRSGLEDVGTPAAGRHHAGRAARVPTNRPG
ncbi:phosphatase PAP2 family protein [Actinoallomurus spadix]|uniref:phosphatase PAP2 family protein n=1 Tax=Actinoallomurus spadix TaxID=79912 RepID=UPI0020935E84|nr:phosphatase PAP2 family protein [Actinoallomurus spadix]MCO5987775.1 phosphatase PAP2 family protein [Actinoallomurus spadix]